MAKSETYEVAITSISGQRTLLPASLQHTTSNDTFESLFNRLLNEKLNQKIKPKSLECECFTHSKSTNGCTVSLKFNIHSTAKRHNFIRIVYKIDIPSLSPQTASSDQSSPDISSISNATKSDKKYSKFHELANHLNKSRSAHKLNSRRKSYQKSRATYKIFQERDSLLTLLFKVPEFKSMYFIFLAGFGLFFTSIIIDDYLNKGAIFDSMSLIKWNFNHYMAIYSTWIFMFLYQFFLVLLFYSYRHNLSFFAYFSQSITHYSYIGCYALYMIPLFVYPPFWAKEFNISGSLIIACEQTRFILKSHAFFVETFKTKRYFDQHKPEKNTFYDNNNNNGDDDEKLHESADQNVQKMEKKSDFEKFDGSVDMEKMPWIVDINMNFADMIVCHLYFLFCPMLVYRTNYPRTKKIRWYLVWHYFRDVALTIIAVWVIFCRFCIPVYRKSVIDPGNITLLLSEFINGSLPGMMLLLLGFFGFLHSWLNMFAELTRFGDRQFYQDWWNARSFAQYYRKWNCVVHDWIYNYLYLPVLEAGYSKTFAMGVVFGTSAMIHEYILMVAFDFWFPVLLFMFGGLGVFFVPLTRLWRNARGWNIFLWSMLLIGQGILLVLYSREYYARGLNENDAVFQLIDQTSWMPYSMQLFLKSNEVAAVNQKTEL